MVGAQLVSQRLPAIGNSSSMRIALADMTRTLQMMVPEVGRSFSKAKILQRAVDYVSELVVCCGCYGTVVCDG